MGTVQEDLRAAVEAGDPSAILLARRAGRAASRMLADLARHEQAEARLGALRCLAEIGGPEADDAFGETLTDAHPQVVGEAVRGLGRQADPSRVGMLLLAYDRCTNGWARRTLALLLGRIEKGVPLDELKRRSASEKEAVAEEGLLAARARLGDAEARDEFARRLGEATGLTRLRWLDLCGEAQGPWLLKAFRPLLDDRTPAVHTGADGWSHTAETLRVCDVAVNWVVGISGRRFGFPARPAFNYGTAEIDEVKRYLEGLK